jgi:hypothetical protein
MNDDPVVSAYMSFRRGYDFGPMLPEWMEMAEWQRDAMRVAYLRGILDGGTSDQRKRG